VHEGLPYAAEISKAGFNAFVLKYRVGQGGIVATQDLAAALAFIFRQADALGVTRRGHSLWGSSAGARLAASIGSYGVARFGGADLPKPSAVVMAYTAYPDITSGEPPTFVVVGDQDGISPPFAMERRLQDRDCRMLTGRDADRACRLAPQLSERRQFRFDLFKSRRNRFQPDAGLRRRDAARGARKQPQLQPFLQALNSLAQSGLRDAQLGAGLGEAALLRTTKVARSLKLVGAIDSTALLAPLRS
jgi:hypothetical protein